MASFARIALTLLIFWTEKCMSQTQNNNPSRITVSKEKITLTANATTPGTDVTVTCQPPLSGVEGVTAMNIKRRAIGTPAGSESILVSAISYKINGEAQLIDKTLMAATVSGSLTTQTISLMMTQAKCSDEGTYVCVVAYGDSAGNAITATSSKDLIAEVGPGQVTMTYSDRPYGREAWMVNDTLTLTCQAPVGTVNTTASTPDPQVTWVWQYKNADGEYPGSIGYWQTFIPASPDTITTGNFIADNTLSCNNYKRQTSTLQRYLELADSGRMYRCLVRRGGADYEQFAGIYTVSDVTEDGQTPPTTDASETRSADAGAIVGGVIGALVVIAVIIIIIYFLVIRPRRQRDREYTDGSTEKGGNKDAAPPYTVSADPAPVYSQPVKRSSKTKDTDTALQEKEGGVTNKAMDHSDEKPVPSHTTKLTPDDNDDRRHGRQSHKDKKNPVDPVEPQQATQNNYAPYVSSKGDRDDRRDRRRREDDRYGDDRHGHSEDEDRRRERRRPRDGDHYDKPTHYDNNGQGRRNRGYENDRGGKGRHSSSEDGGTDQSYVNTSQYSLGDGDPTMGTAC